MLTFLRRVALHRDGFLCIRVEVELAKPLMRGYIVKVEDDKPIWVDF
jgi:hypothetical protein